MTFLGRLLDRVVFTTVPFPDEPTTFGYPTPVLGVEHRSGERRSPEHRPPYIGPERRRQIAEVAA
jgi:hypothetical protein